jgi:hypothetical protein
MYPVVCRNDIMVIVFCVVVLTENPDYLLHKLLPDIMNQ